jgi:hypothetical protein
MPISTNANALRMKTTASHTAKIGTRMRAGICGPPRRAAVMAKATSVRMPDSPIASAAIQTQRPHRHRDAHAGGEAAEDGEQEHRCEAAKADMSGTSQRATSATANTVVPTAAITSPATGRQVLRRSRNEVS